MVNLRCLTKSVRGSSEDSEASAANIFMTAKPADRVRSAHRFTVIRHAGWLDACKFKTIEGEPNKLGTVPTQAEKMPTACTWASGFVAARSCLEHDLAALSVSTAPYRPALFDAESGVACLRPSVTATERTNQTPQTARMRLGLNVWRLGG